MYNISLSKGKHIKVLGSSDLTRPGGIFDYKKNVAKLYYWSCNLRLSVVSIGLDIFNLNWLTIVC